MAAKVQTAWLSDLTVVESCDISSLGSPPCGGIAHPEKANVGTPYASPQANYDLRKLRDKGFLERIGDTRRYRPTSEGLRIAVAVASPPGFPRRESLLEVSGLRGPVALGGMACG